MIPVDQLGHLDQQALNLLLGLLHLSDQVNLWGQLDLEHHPVQEALVFLVLQVNPVHLSLPVGLLALRDLMALGSQAPPFLLEILLALFSLCLWNMNFYDHYVP